MVPTNASPNLFSSLCWRSGPASSATFLCLSWFQLGYSRCVCAFQTPSICFVPSGFLCVFVYSHQQNINQSTGQQSGRQSDAVYFEEVIHYISNVEMTAVRRNTPWTRTHTHRHTCSSVWENRDRSQPDLTIAQRKRSIKQQVHFSAEAFKNMAANTLQELCWRGQEISPR